MIQSSWVVFSAVAFIHLFFERVGRQKPESSGRTCQRASFKLESTNKKFTWRFRSPDINVHRVLLQAIKSTSGNLSSSSEKLFNCSRKSPLLYFFFFFLHVDKFQLPVQHQACEGGPCKTRRSIFYRRYLQWSRFSYPQDFL